MKEVLVIILIFYTYSFLGWLMEVLTSIIQYRKFINRGFLIGPICPIYGFGGVGGLLFLSKYQDDPLVLFVFAIVAASVLEYITSYLLEKIFKNRWWDYSKMTLNINGRICLECSVPFGIIGLILVYGTNPLLFANYSSFSESFLMVIIIILAIITLIDIIVSCSVIINLKNISNSIRCDSTEVITKKVREIIGKKNILSRRLLDSFPKMQISNKISLLKDKITKSKKQYRELKKKTKKKIKLFLN